MDVFDHVVSQWDKAHQRLLQLSNTTEEEKNDDVNLWYVGVIIYALGAFSMALGVVLQKYSINREHIIHPDPSSQRPLPKQPLWVLGIILYGASGGLLSAALGFAAQSLLTPLMSIVIISNALLARFLLYEPITKRDTISIGIIVIAVIATTVSAPSVEQKPTTEELIELYKEAGFIVYVILLLILLSFFYIANKRIGKKKLNHEDTTAREDFLYAFSFGASAGCWGGLTVTMMKSAITIIQDKINTGGFGAIFTEGLMYGLVIILGTCWYMQLKWINLGLERFPAVFVVSIEAVLNKIIGVSGGILYFQEYKLFTVGKAIGFVFGLGLGVFGIILFALRDNTVGPEEDFFTCCPMPPLTDDKRKGSIMKKGSIKSVVSGNEVIFVDENGKEVERGSEDEEYYEYVESPIHLLVEGTSQGLRMLGGLLWSYIAPEEEESVENQVATETGADATL
uniref:Uncharacterized protein n=1 Tax=Aplanochytrium stocchinoi TaxID=215587 RepID=A0A7S3LR87_9STRA|eukprot:CAMPEP_0204874260 /NCGR_PEP_ID=MMETSP1348-20121228/42678_1 /ASSEMBLY_ACC=CAM_ASM_000700 /TAXON_ID=215587 /ORGANISM="Aplanochytrium stocchinoi, Strain GSBS06" /LENGTH=453 /DNA_ID=CAMNT_0052029983 /DNA_START=382 /DNA_END=1743 /DNA_ORIENTATION=-